MSKPLIDLWLLRVGVVPRRTAKLKSDRFEIAPGRNLYLLVEVERDRFAADERENESAALRLHVAHPVVVAVRTDVPDRHVHDLADPGLTLGNNVQHALAFAMTPTVGPWAFGCRLRDFTLSRLTAELCSRLIPLVHRENAAPFATFLGATPRYLWGRDANGAKGATKLPANDELDRYCRQATRTHDDDDLVGTHPS